MPEWIRTYKQTYLRDDILAGLTVGVLLIPQGMAYAMLAGLPPIYGLYASTIPLIVYAVFGTSRHLSVGPVAIDSMLTAAAVGTIAVAGTGDYISMAIILALMVGVIQFSLGISRLGVLIKFLSHPVIVGFTSAAAIIIGLSQLQHFLGIKMVSSQYMQDVVQGLYTHLAEIHWITFLIGVMGVIFLILIKRISPALPGGLIIVILSTVIVWLLQLDLKGVNTIGSIPSGLPLPQMPAFHFDNMRKLLPSAFAIALISFMESLSVARSLQAKHKTYRVDSNKELLTLGLANMIGSLFKSFPVSGGFSRSAVNEQAGAKSGISSIVSALLVLCTLLFATPLFYYMPNAILAAIIMVSVYKLIRFHEAIFLWNVDRKDFLMMMATFIGTLFFGIGTGIGIGVLLSLSWIIIEASYPHYAQLGRVPGTGTFRNVKRFKELLLEDDVLIFRFDAPLFFANVDRFREILLNYVASNPVKLKAIIVDMESTNSIDTSAITVLQDTIEEIRRSDILFFLAEVKGPVRDKLERSGLTKQIGEENFFMSIENAMDHLSGKDVEPVKNIVLQTNK